MSQPEKPSFKHIAIAVYLLIGIIYALYSWMYGDTAHKSLPYNLGVGLVWPAVIFPVIGKVIGGILTIAFIAFVMAS